MKILMFYSIFLVTGLLFLAVMHEIAHVQIYASYGVDSEIDYFGDFPNFVTRAVNYTPGSCGDACHLAHNINESVGYHLIVMYIMIGLGFFVIIGILDNKKT